MTDVLLAQRLSIWTAALRYEDLPADAVACAKRLLLDTLAVAWAGSGAVGVDPMYRMALRQGGEGESTNWVQGGRLPAMSAALLNGVYASSLDFDSVHDEATVHPDIVVLPALLAVAERDNVSGRDFLAAHVAGDELMVRLALGVQRHPGWFFSSVLGVFASAASCARAMGQDAEGVRTAMGVALGRASGTQQSLMEGTFTKRLQSAFAARDGLESALLAAVGVTSPEQIFEGAAGVEELYTGLDHARVLDGLGSQWQFESLTLKNFPSCFCNHAAIVATIELVRRHGIGAADVEDCSVVLTPFSARLVGAPFSPSDSPQVAAQFSAQYSVANVLQRGGFGVGDIDPSAVLDPAIIALAGRVRVSVDSTSTGKFAPATVRVRTRDGRMLSERVDTIPGTPAQPATGAELRRKAAACFACGPRPMPPQHVGQLMERIDRLETLQSMRDLLRFD